MDLDGTLSSDASFESDVSDMIDESSPDLQNLQPGDIKPSTAMDVVQSLSTDSNIDECVMKKRRLRKRRPKPDFDIGNASLSALQAPCWDVPLYIGDARIEFLFDSGSMITAIAKDTFDKIPGAADCKLKPHRGTLSAANGQPIAVHGHCTVPLHFGGLNKDRTYPTQVLIADISNSAIIGMNFMVDNGINLDFRDGTISVDGITVFSHQGKDQVKTQRLRCSKTTYIPPRSESLIPISHRRDMTNKATRLVQPSYRFTTATGLFLGRTLTEFQNNHALAIVVNPSDEPVVVARGLDVGFSYPIDSLDSNHSPDLSPKSTDTTSSALARSTADANEPLPPFLEQMVPTDQLDTDQLRRVRSLLQQYSSCFMSPTSKQGKTDIVEHQINTEHNLPIRQRIRRVPFAQHEIIEKELDKMLDADVIEPSISPWASPVVLVTKKDGSTRFCVDFRRLNHVTVKDSYPLPNIEDTFNAMSGARYFCALDLASGYWQIPMADADKPKTAFITRRGLFQFKVMPFGLCNAPATFERLMEAILRGLLWERCMVYIDDIIVYGRSFDQTLANLETVLQRVKASHLKLKPSKCELFKAELLYLGFLINGSGVRPDPAKVQAVREWPVPCNISDVRSYLGFANYHRRFVKQYASIAAL